MLKALKKETKNESDNVDQRNHCRIGGYRADKQDADQAVDGKSLTKPSEPPYHAIPTDDASISNDAPDRTRDSVSGEPVSTAQVSGGKADVNNEHENNSDNGGDHTGGDLGEKQSDPDE